MKIIHFFFFALAVIAIHGCQTRAQNTNTDRDIANIRAAYDALNQRDWDAFAALCDGENYVDVNVGPAPTKGVTNAIEIYQQFMAAYPDLKLELTDIAPAGNGRYLLRLNISGTHTGPFMGIPPTGKLVKWTDADVVVLNEAGKCVSHEITNAGAPLAQIGHASMLNPATQVVMAVYEKFGKGDVPGILAMCDDKVVFDIEDHMFDSKARTFTGKNEVGKFFEELAAKGKYGKFEPTRFVADGDDVFINVATEYEHLPTKKKYASNYTHQFKVVNGKVVWFRGLDGFAKAL